MLPFRTARVDLAQDHLPSQDHDYRTGIRRHTVGSECWCDLCARWSVAFKQSWRPRKYNFKSEFFRFLEDELQGWSLLQFKLSHRRYGVDQWNRFNQKYGRTKHRRQYRDDRFQTSNFSTWQLQVHPNSHELQKESQNARTESSTRRPIPERTSSMTISRSVGQMKPFWTSTIWWEQRWRMTNTELRYTARHVNISEWRHHGESVQESAPPIWRTAISYGAVSTGHISFSKGEEASYVRLNEMVLRSVEQEKQGQQFQCPEWRNISSGSSTDSNSKSKLESQWERLGPWTRSWRLVPHGQQQENVEQESTTRTTRGRGKKRSRCLVRNETKFGNLREGSQRCKSVRKVATFSQSPFSNGQCQKDSALKFFKPPECSKYNTKGGRLSGGTACIHVTLAKKAGGDQMVRGTTAMKSDKTMEFNCGLIDSHSSTSSVGSLLKNFGWTQTKTQFRVRYGRQAEQHFRTAERSGPSQGKQTWSQSKRLYVREKKVRVAANICCFFFRTPRIRSSNQQVSHEQSPRQESAIVQGSSRLIMHLTSESDVIHEENDTILNSKGIHHSRWNNYDDRWSHRLCQRCWHVCCIWNY